MDDQLDCQYESSSVRISGSSLVSENVCTTFSPRPCYPSMNAAAVLPLHEHGIGERLERNGGGLVCMYDLPHGCVTLA